MAFADDPCVVRGVGFRIRNRVVVTASKGKVDDIKEKNVPLFVAIYDYGAASIRPVS